MPNIMKSGDSPQIIEGFKSIVCPIFLVTFALICLIR